MRYVIITFLALIVISVLQPVAARHDGSALALAVSEFLGVTSAQAQQQRKSLFKLLRERTEKRRAKTKKRRQQLRERVRKNAGIRKKTARKPSTKTTKRASTTARKKTTTASRTTTRKKTRPQTVQKPVVAVEKKPDAGKILVVGDFMAGALARGLEKRYVENADIVVINTSKPDSGIVRDDVIDWPKKIPEFLEEHKPIAVIALVGMNDRQQMRLETGRVEKLGEAWTVAYRNRISAIASATGGKNVPFLWVGLPPVKSSRMNTDYLAFNEMYRTIVESNEGSFVDVWDGFTDAEGKYVSAGPDVNGKIVRLRGSKGITMSSAGRDKLAFFADKELRRLGIIDGAAGLKLAGLGEFAALGARQSIPDYDPVGARQTVVISLGAPALDGGTELEGGDDFLKADDGKDSVSHKLVASGLTQAPRPGRIDAAWGLPTEVETVQAKDSNSVVGPPAPPVTGAATQSRVTLPQSQAGASAAQ